MTGDAVVRRHLVFRFHYVERKNDTERPKVYTSRWAMTVEDANSRVRRGEWLIAVPSSHDAMEITSAGARSLPAHEAMGIVEELIQAGNVLNVLPTPEVV
jgi:hypothetical protein